MEYPQPKEELLKKNKEVIKGLMNTAFKSNGFVISLALKFNKKNNHVLKNIRFFIRKGKAFVSFDGSDGKKIVLIPSTRETMCIDKDKKIYRVSCGNDDVYDPVIGVSLAEKKANLKKKDKRSFRRYKDALNDLVEILESMELSEKVAVDNQSVDSCKTCETCGLPPDLCVCKDMEKE